MMEFREYINLTGKLYISGLMSGYGSKILRTIGGVLAIASKDFGSFYYEVDEKASFFDSNIIKLSKSRGVAKRFWKNHLRQILVHIENGAPPWVIIEAYFDAYGSVPHSPEKLLNMVLGTPASSLPYWQFVMEQALSAERERRREILESTQQGALADLFRFGHIVAYAKDWTRPTYEEWSRANDVAQIGAFIGEGASIAASSSTQRQQVIEQNKPQKPETEDVITQQKPKDEYVAPHRRATSSTQAEPQHREAAQPPARKPDTAPANSSTASVQKPGDQSATKIERPVSAPSLSVKEDPARANGARANNRSTSSEQEPATKQKPILRNRPLTRGADDRERAWARSNAEAAASKKQRGTEKTGVPKGKPSDAARKPILRNESLTRGADDRERAWARSNAEAAASKKQRGTEKTGVPKGKPSNAARSNKKPTTLRKTDAPGAMRESIPPFHRTGPLAGQPYQPLRVLEAILLPRERKAVAALVGKFPERARAIWQQDTPANRRALEVMKEVDRHYASKNSEQAKALADQVYADKLERFWGGVRKDPVLKGMINEAALVFDEKSEVSAPYWLLPDGTKEVLTIDHMTPRRIDPRKAIDPNNLQFSPARENTFMLEYIRKNQTIDWQ